MTKQYDALQLRSEIEAKRLERELQETRAIGEKTLSEADSKLDKFKKNYEMTLQETQNRYLEDLQKDRGRIDTLARENDQLRNFLAGGGPAGGAGVNRNNMLM